MAQAGKKEAYWPEIHVLADILDVASPGFCVSPRWKLKFLILNTGLILYYLKGEKWVNIQIYNVLNI